MKVKKVTEDIYFKQIGTKRKDLQKVLFQKGQLPLWTESWIKNPVFRFKAQVKEEKISSLYSSNNLKGIRTKILTGGNSKILR